MVSTPSAPPARPAPPDPGYTPQRVQPARPWRPDGQAGLVLNSEADPMADDVAAGRTAWPQPQGMVATAAALLEQQRPTPGAWTVRRSTDYWQDMMPPPRMLPADPPTGASPTPSEASRTAGEVTLGGAPGFVTALPARCSAATAFGSAGGADALLLQSDAAAVELATPARAACHRAVNPGPPTRYLVRGSSRSRFTEFYASLVFVGSDGASVFRPVA